jgi:hypothetical protein
VAHKSKYITELHAAQVTYSPTKLIHSAKLHGATPQKAITLTARREPTIPKEITFIFLIYKGSILSLIVPYV